jgi:hypothetical protein
MKHILNTDAFQLAVFYGVLFGLLGYFFSVVLGG